MHLFHGGIVQLCFFKIVFGLFVLGIQGSVWTDCGFAEQDSF